MINQSFNWNKARMDCFVGMIIALIRTRNVNLTELAIAFPSPVKVNSRYRRIQRFINEYTINFDTVAWFIMGLFNFLNNDYYLVLDRTNWKLGEKNLNILVLAVAYRGIAIPIYWMMLNKRGNSNHRERIALLNRFIKHFGQKHILALLADREFIGTKWFKYLNKKEIPFVLRIKKNAKTTNSRKEQIQVQHLFRFLKAGEQLIIKDARIITKVSIYLTGLRLSDGELLIVASNKQDNQAIKHYKERWQIETLFSCLKSRGFNLENTHITKLLRIKRFLVIPVIAFCWAHRVGEWQQDSIKPIKINKHQRPVKSIFRVGLDFIRNILFKQFPTDYSTTYLFSFLQVNPPCCSS